MHTTLFDTTRHLDRAILGDARVAVAPPLADLGAAPLLGVTRSFPKDATLYDEGECASVYFKVVSGVVRTVKLLTDGRRQIDAFHVAGDVFGLERGETYHFSAEAVGEVAVIAYRRGGCEGLAAVEVSQARQMLAATLANLERAQQHMILLGRKSAMEKVATFLIEISERLHAHGAGPHFTIELPMSRSDIADYLGLTIETVSRTLTQLERDGVIALPVARRTIVLNNRSTLRRLSA